MTELARTSEQRKRDTLERLEHDVDAWVATAGEAGGAPWLVPLSFLWDGNSLLIATPASSVTGRNLWENGRVRIGIGPTRDLVLIEGTARTLADGELPDEVGDAFAIRTGFDPRQLRPSYTFIRIYPVRIQAWREARATVIKVVLMRSCGSRNGGSRSAAGPVSPGRAPHRSPR